MRAPLTGSLLLLALTTSAGAAVTGVPLTVQPESRLWVEGTSTVRSFRCKAADLDARIDAANAQAAAAVVAGTKAVRSVEVKIAADKLDCGNATMNEHMRKAIRVKEAPVIRFTLGSYDLAPKSGGSAVTMNGQLSLGGTEKPISLQAEASEGPNGSLKVTGTKELKLSDFGLKAPSLMMGTMKVADAVTVRYELTLRP